jgi:uncharacterized surface protein with fasciclin (FAS1) repeats
MLAPTDEAFEALPANILKQLLRPENKAQLVTILKYHVISGEIPEEIIARGGVRWQPLRVVQFKLLSTRIMVKSG